MIDKKLNAKVEKLGNMLKELKYTIASILGGNQHIWDLDDMFHMIRAELDTGEKKDPNEEI